MIILENSEKAIKGLAKLIIQEPRFILELNIMRKAFEENKILSSKSKDEKYLGEQLEIIKKAEKIANESLWYGFEIYDNFHEEHKGFMLYKRIDNKMVPLEEDFERGFSPKMREWEDLEETIEKRGIKNLVTYTPFDFDTLCSQQYEVELDEPDETPISHEHQHMELAENYLDYLKEKELKITEFSEKQVKEFEKNLEFVSNY